MTSRHAAAELAAQAYELYQQDCLEEAEAKYRQALQLARPGDFALADYHGEFAAVLDGLGKLAEAERELNASLEVEIDRAAHQGEVGVTVARYFLAEFLLRHGHPRRALAVVLPGSTDCREAVWLLHSVEAEALAALGDRDAAEQAARRALGAAPSEDQRSELRLRFLEVGLHDVAV